MGLGQLHSPTGKAKKDLFPKFKTLAWVRWQSDLDKRNLKSLASGF
jgi:hypothetical protein